MTGQDRMIGRALLSRPAVGPHRSSISTTAETAHRSPTRTVASFNGLLSGGRVLEMLSWLTSVSIQEYSSIPGAAR